VFEKDKPLNGRCDTFKLSHRRGSPQLVRLLATVLETLAMVNEKILHGALWLVTGRKDPASYEAKVVTVYAAGQHTDRFRVQTSVTKSVDLTA
jgi:hypothetical protein